MSLPDWSMSVSDHLSIGIFFDGLSIPPKEGATVHTYELATALADRDGVHVTMIVADRSRATLEQLAAQSFDTILLPPDHYYDRNKISELLEERAFDVVQNKNAYYVASVLGPVAEALSVSLVVEHHDVEADLLFLYDTPEDVVFQSEMQQLATDYSVRSRVISSYDYEKLQRSVLPEHAKKLFYLPVSLGGQYAPQRACATYGKSCVFVGNMPYAPNRRAAIRIIERIAPKMPDFTFLIIGRESEALVGRVRSHNVRLLGPVADLSAAFGDAAVGLAPLEIGSGIKIKVITYLAAGMPVIATEVALRGFPDRDAVIEADDDQDFVNKIRLATADRSRWDVLSQDARKTYDDTFSHRKTVDVLLSIYSQAANEKVTRTFPGKDIGPPDMRRFPWHLELRSIDRPTVASMTLIRGLKNDCCI